MPRHRVDRVLGPLPLSPSLFPLSLSFLSLYLPFTLFPFLSYLASSDRLSSSPVSLPRPSLCLTAGVVEREGQEGIRGSRWRRLIGGQRRVTSGGHYSSYKQPLRESEEGLLLRQLAKRSAETNDPAGDICIRPKISSDFLYACYYENVRSEPRLCRWGCSGALTPSLKTGQTATQPNESASRPIAIIKLNINVMSTRYAESPK